VKESLVNAGVDENKIELVGAVRFNNVFNFNEKNLKAKYRKDLQIKEDDFLIFMPISQFLNENQALLRELSSALKRLSIATKIVLKINPNKKYDNTFITAIKNELKQMPNSTDVTLLVEDSRYYELMKASDIVILSGGTASLEAMFMGVDSIIFETKNSINHNPIIKYEKVFGMAYDQNDLLKYLKAFFNKSFIVDEDEKKLMLDELFAGKTIESKTLFKKQLDQLTGENTYDK
jgi:spore coat polysaccharide biosynthesis predicted glycosyltransferase SpsG